jgi:uncharacterized protein involved in response to NO
MPAALQRRREYAGPVLFSYGYRPFFLGGAVWTALGVLMCSRSISASYHCRPSLPLKERALAWCPPQLAQ